MLKIHLKYLIKQDMPKIDSNLRTILHFCQMFNHDNPSTKSKLCFDDPNARNQVKPIQINRLF